MALEILCSRCMRILIRLPNWLGDLVMSTAFVRAIAELYPDAKIEVIVKKGIDAVVDYLPGIYSKHVFDKTAYKGLSGAWRFGKMLTAVGRPDIFICLPDSFSSAWMAKATGASLRIGYAKELRGILLSKTMQKNHSLHRVDQYLELLQLLGKKQVSVPAVFLQNSATIMPNRILVNVNSEADSRRLPIPKAIAILDKLRNATHAEIMLVGSPKELPHVTAVVEGMANKHQVLNMAGKTDMHGLINLLGSAPVMLTTDSGPMHVANALGTHTVALEGASDEKNTAPYNADQRTLIRYGQLPCEPCVKNTCQFGVPKCLMGMNEEIIVQEVLAVLTLASASNS